MRFARVGQRSIAVVSRMRTHGSVSRGTCARSKDCAKRGCQAPPAHDNAGRDCSDLNLQAIFDELGLHTDHVLAIGCAGDAVGFHDETDPGLIKPRRGGFRELIPDYAAYFTAAEAELVLATHMADCGFLAVELPGAHGYIHLTRLNMAAMDALKIATDHYGCHVSDARLRLVAAISGPNFPQFGDPEARFPGWADAGFIMWRDNEIWEPDNRGMLRKQILDAGVAPEQLDLTDVLDPGDLTLGHASHSAGVRGEIPLGRDAYLIGPRRLFGLLALEPVSSVVAQESR